MGSNKLASLTHKFVLIQEPLEDVAVRRATKSLVQASTILPSPLEFSSHFSAQELTAIALSNSMTGEAFVFSYFDGVSIILLQCIVLEPSK